MAFLVASRRQRLRSLRGLLVALFLTSGVHGFSSTFKALSFHIHRTSFISPCSSQQHRRSVGWTTTNNALTRRYSSSSFNSNRRRERTMKQQQVVQEIGVGIDLGTTNSAIAILMDGVPTIIPIPQPPPHSDSRTLPSVVSYTRQEERNHETQDDHDDNSGDDDFVVLVGRPAMEQEASSNNNNIDTTTATDRTTSTTTTTTTTFRHVKRIMGMGMKRALQIATTIVPHLHVPSAMDGGSAASSGPPNKSKHHKRNVKVAESLAKQLQDAQDNPAKLSLVVSTTTTSSSTSSVLSSPPMTLLPEQVSAHIVQTLLAAVTSYTTGAVRMTRAVVGVPAYFDDAQRQATIRAVQLAGISKVKLLREPEAAALAYGLVHHHQRKPSKSQQDEYNEKDDDESNVVDDADADDQEDVEELVLVFDLGGGTFDVSILLVGGGICEVLATSGNTQLGGTDFDAQLVQSWLRPLLQQIRSLATMQQRQQQQQQQDDTDNNDEEKRPDRTWTVPTEQLLTTAEAVRIHLSNHRQAHLALPISSLGWKDLYPPSRVLLSAAEYQEQMATLNKTMTTTTTSPFSSSTLSKQQKQKSPTAATSILTNGTHAFTVLSRNAMERFCHEQFLALLRPIREVAILAGALLPGDTRPGIVQAVLDDEEGEEDGQGEGNIDAAMDNFPDFYEDEDDDDDEGPQERINVNTKILNDNNAEEDSSIRQQLQSFVVEMQMKEQKKAQQRGRQKARDVAKGDRKFRMEKKAAAAANVFASSSSSRRGGSASSGGGGSSNTAPPAVLDVKVRDGIVGRPIAQVILVGGATRMPAIGRLLTAMTGVVPQRTVNPDEAVALGCAVQVGVLDGVSDLTVLSPMQAAILRAFAEQKQKEQGTSKPRTEITVPRDADDEDDDDLSTYDYV